LGNAIKFSAEGSVITLDIREQNDYLMLSVKDEGVGISEEDQRHLSAVSTGGKMRLILKARASDCIL